MSRYPSMYGRTTHFPRLHHKPNWIDDAEHGKICAVCGLTEAYNDNVHYGMEQAMTHLPAEHYHTGTNLNIIITPEHSEKLSEICYREHVTVQNAMTRAIDMWIDEQESERIRAEAKEALTHVFDDLLSLERGEDIEVTRFVVDQFNKAVSRYREIAGDAVRINMDARIEANEGSCL